MTKLQQPPLDVSSSSPSTRTKQTRARPRTKSLSTIVKALPSADGSPDVAEGDRIIVQIAVAIERIEQLREEVRALKKERHGETELLRGEIANLRKQVDELRTRTDKWKWGLLTMGGLGAVFMYVIDIGTKLAALFSKVIR